MQGFSQSQDNLFKNFNMANIILIILPPRLTFFNICFQKILWGFDFSCIVKHDNCNRKKRKSREQKNKQAAFIIRQPPLIVNSSPACQSQISA